MCCSRVIVGSVFCRSDTHVIVALSDVLNLVHNQRKQVLVMHCVPAMQVTLTINYNPPALLGRHGDHDQSLFHTYVRRVCSSKPNQLVFNLWAGQAEGKSIAALEKHFDLKICTLDLVQIEHILSFNM